MYVGQRDYIYNKGSVSAIKLQHCQWVSKVAKKGLSMSVDVPILINKYVVDIATLVSNKRSAIP
jgi:hypothetical protein